MNDKSITHFGITVSIGARGYTLTRDNYATVENRSTLGKNKLYIQALERNNEKLIKAYSEIYVDKEGLIYSDNWCQKHLIEVMANFDLNMTFFQNLDHSKFNDEITRFLKKTKFIEITDLNEYSCPGYYAIILDKYCQLYIGTSENIKRRIRQHWAGGKLKFDSLIFGQVTKSKLSIDSFRALDTTRILVYPTNKTYCQENNFINYFSDEFVSNRIGGGIMEFGVLSVVSSMKKRNLNK